ncbi:VHS domain-containing protein [Pseudozyma hubeiensis]|nr:VHS domain-containing protein [Pseudozyma hubeiensis]
MKKFFKPKEAGTITPLPPASPGVHSSSFSTPRPFDEYQARMASHARDSNRPLSLQVPPVASRSAPDSPERSSYARTYSPTSQQRRGQQLGISPRKNRSPNQLHAVQAADAAYGTYSDPISAQSQTFRPSFERQNTSDYDLRSSPTPRRTNSQRVSQQQQPPHMAAFSPPRSLRPAQPAAHHHRRDNSWSTGTSPGAASLQSHSQARNGERHSLQVAPGSLVSSHFSGPARRQRSDGSYDSQDDTFNHDLDERTPTASDATRSAAYPVYSGADGDDDAGEVLISQGRYEETTLRELNPKDKGKAKKLFGFATGSGKDKKGKQDRDIAVTAPSPVPRHSRDRSRDDLRLMSPPTNSQPLSTQERSKEGGWMDRWNKRAHQQQAARLHDKEAEEAVASHIGWLSANANNEQDWMQILPLIGIISDSDAASKEAARALRKEFKYGEVDTQRRAVRIWALLTLNSSDRFRQQVASKRFLDAIEDSIASSKTPLSVKETMLRVLGVLAFEFRDDAELVSVTKCWNKVKPNDRKKDGEPLEDDLFEFRLPQPTGLMQQQQQPASRRASQPRLQPPRRGAAYHEPDLVVSPPQQRPFTADSADQQRHLHSAAFAPPPPHPPGLPASMQPQAALPEQQHAWPRPNLPAPSLQPQTRTAATVVSPPMIVDQHNSRSATDVISTLEAAAASMDSRSASMHSNHSSVSQRDDVLTFDEDVRCLHEECQIARSNAAVLVDTLLHEGLHSGTLELVEEFHGKVVRSQDLIASQIPWASSQADRSRAAVPVGGERETREEALLADLLEAHGRSGEAIHMVEDARRRIEEEEAERQATERSKVEVRLDRSALAQDSLTGELYDVGGRGRAGLLGVQASGSRSPSPNAGGFTSPQKAANSAPSGVSPAFGASDGNGVPVLPPRISRPLPVPRSDQSSDSNTSTTSFPHPHHTTAHSLTASIHSTTSSITSSTHSRDTPLNAAGGRSPLPVTPPSLNIDTKKKGWEEEGDEMQTPVVPSEKALGKRRAVSVRYPTPPQGQKAPPVPPQPGVGDALGAMGGLRLG